MSGPRQHHYLFAHRELPAAAFRFGGGLLAAGREGRLSLAGAWNSLGEALPEADRLPAGGLTVTYHPLPPTHEALLIHFSPPEHPAEAHFAAIVLRTPLAAAPPFAAASADGADSAEGGAVRYFTLEDARSPVDGRRYTVLGEWTVEHSHLNLGPGPGPEAGLFLAAVAAHLRP